MMPRRRHDYKPETETVTASNQNNCTVVKHLMRIIVATISLCTMLLTVFGSVGAKAHAGTADRYGNNAEIYSVTVTPVSVPAGTYPEIKGYVSNTSSAKNGNDGKAVFDVMAVITLPNGSQKSLLWQNVRFGATQKKFYTFVNTYGIGQSGNYKIVYSVYNQGRTHLYASAAKSFTVTSPAVASAPGSTLAGTGEVSRAAKAGRPKKEAAPPTARPQEEKLPQPAAPTQVKKPSEYEVRGRKQTIGVGAYVNTLNFSAGPSLILWPSNNVAVQGTYGLGTFTSYEARIFYRMPLSQHFNPYFGAGYLHTERKARVVGIETRIKGDSFSAFGGIELPLYKSLYAYADISATPMKLKKDITTGTTLTTVTVEYSPVTVCFGLVLYLF